MGATITLPSSARSVAFIGALGPTALTLRSNEPEVAEAAELL